MTLLQLQYFETLARVLHYTRAAEELHIAQPSLSYSIGELEKELGVKLFEKENRKNPSHRIRRAVSSLCPESTACDG